MGAELVAGDVVTAHGYSLLLQSQLGPLLDQLAVKVRRLPEREWIRELENPFRAIALHGTTSQEAVSRLSDEDLLEYCRYTNWSREHRINGMARWWLSKHMSILKHKLRTRGICDQAWRDGTEVE